MSVAYAKTNVHDIQMKRFVRSVFVKYKSGPQKTLEEKLTTVNAVYGSSLGLPGSLDNVLVLKDKIVEEDASWDPFNLTSKNHRGSSVSQRNQDSCRDFSLSLPHNFQAVQILIRKALASLPSSRDGSESLVKHKECSENKAKLEASPGGSRSKLPDYQRRGKEVELTKEIVHQPASKVDKAEKELNASQGNV